MKRALPTIVCIVAAGVLAGCAPLIRVENRTQLGAYVLILQNGKSSKAYWHTAVRVPPRGRYAVDGLEGKYFIDALPDKAWRNYVNKVRIELENEFRYPKDLPRDKIRILTQRLANLLQEFERSYNAGLVPDKPGYQTAFCSGVIGNSEDDVRVVVDSTPSGAFTVTCESSPKKPASSQ